MTYAIDIADSGSVNLGSNPSPLAIAEALISSAFLHFGAPAKRPFFMSHMLLFKSRRCFLGL